MLPDTRFGSRTRRLAFAIDLSIAALVLLTIGIEFSGGLRLSIAGLRISAHSPGRVLAALLVLAVVRFLVVARASAFGVPTDRWRAPWLRIYRPTAWPTSTTGSSARARHVLWAACGLTAACALVLHEQLAHMHSVPDLGDPLFSMWRIGWVFHQMHGDPRSLFDANIFYPFHNTLAYSENLIGSALIAAPVVWLTGNTILAMNIVVLLSGDTISNPILIFEVWMACPSASKGSHRLVPALSPRLTCTSMTVPS